MIARHIKFHQPPLPYSFTSLEPMMSAQTLRLHYNKHQKAYIDKVNELLSNQEHCPPLEEIIRHSKVGSSISNQSAQAWNHQFFWNCLSGSSQHRRMSRKLKLTIEQNFDSFEQLKEKFATTAIQGFGSGWTWLERKKDGRLEINWRPNAETPLQTPGLVPILVCDVWEHAYYIDCHNDRKRYLKNFWRLINWKFVEQCLLADKVVPFEFRKGIPFEKKVNPKSLANMALSTNA